jgi:hypothetical protein
MVVKAESAIGIINYAHHTFTYQKKNYAPFQLIIKKNKNYVPFQVLTHNDCSVNICK